MYEIHWVEEEFYAQDGEWNTWKHSEKFDTLEEMKEKYETLKQNPDNKKITMTQVLEEFVR